MEKEKYEPTLEEVEKAEEMAVEGEMTQEQEKMSKERSGTFEAGQEKEREIVLDNIRKYKEAAENSGNLGNYESYELLDVFIKNEVDIDKYFKEVDSIASNYKLSFNAKRALIEDILYIPERGEFILIRGVMPKTLMELLEKLPQISKYGILGPGAFSESVIQKINERFPEAEII